MFRVVFVAAAVLTLAAPAFAQTPDPAPAARSGKDLGGVTVTGKKVSPGAPDPKEIVCHREPVLGSLFPKEICARREDIAERRRQDQKDTREATNLRPYSCAQTGSC